MRCVTSSVSRTNAEVGELDRAAFARTGTNRVRPHSPPAHVRTDESEAFLVPC